MFVYVVYETFYCHIEGDFTDTNPDRVFKAEEAAKEYVAVMNARSGNDKWSYEKVRMVE